MHDLRGIIDPWLVIPLHDGHLRAWSGRQDDFPEDAALLQQPEGRRRLRKRKHTVDHRRDAACAHKIGWPERPATWEALCEKFGDCAAPVLSQSQIADAIAMIGDLENLALVRDLVRVLVSRPVR